MILKYIDMLEEAEKLEKRTADTVMDFSAQLEEAEIITAVVIEAKPFDGLVTVGINTHNFDISDDIDRLYNWGGGFDLEEFTYTQKLKKSDFKHWEQYLQCEYQYEARSKPRRKPVYNRDNYFVYNYPELKRKIKRLTRDSLVIPIVDVDGNRKIVYSEIDAIPLEIPFLRMITYSLILLSRDERFRALPDWETIQLGCQNYDGDVESILFDAGEAEELNYPYFLKPTHHEVPLTA